MELHPIQNFNQMSIKQKAATIAAATVATATIASVPLAYVKGKGSGEEKVLEAIKQGYKKIGVSISEQFHKIKNNFSKQNAQKVNETAQAEKIETKAEAAAPVVEKAETAVPVVEKAEETVKPVEAKVEKTVEAKAEVIQDAVPKVISNSGAVKKNGKIIINSMNIENI